MATPTITAPRLRERFPTLETATYLVSHSMGAAPLAARDALVAYWEAWKKDGPEAWEAWLPEIVAIADGIATLIGASRGSVSLAPNVSLLQAALASSLDWRGERNEVVFEDLQFPSVTYVWTAWERFGARVVRVPSDDGRTMSTERIVAAITEKTAVVVLSHAAYISAALIDVPRSSRAAAKSARSSSSTSTKRPASIRTTSRRSISISRWAAATSGCAAGLAAVSSI